MLCGQHATAQVNDSLITKDDSLIFITQLLKAHLLQQWNHQSDAYNKMQQNKTAEFLNDTAIVDSLGKMLLQQMQQMKSSIVSTGEETVTGTAQTTQQLLKQQFGKLVQTSSIKNMLAQFTGLIKQPILKFNGGSMSVTGQLAPSVSGDEVIFINNNTFNSGWALAGIPFTMQLMRQDFTDPSYHARNTFSIGFDKDAYLNSLRNSLQQKINAKDMLPDYKDALQQINRGTIKKLQSSLDSINSIYKGALNERLRQWGDLQRVFNGDVKSMQDKLLSADLLKDMENKKNLLSELQNQLGQGIVINKSMYDSLLQSVEVDNKMISRIQSFATETQKSGLPGKLQQAQQFKAREAQQLLQDPDKLKSMVKDQLNLSGVQKLFLNMNQLNLGMHTINLSPLTMFQYSNTGVSAEFTNDKTYLFIMAGKQKEFSSFYDNRFAAPLFATDNTGMGIRAGRGSMQSSYTHISLFTYKQSSGNYGNNLISVAPGKTIVATFSNQLKINENNFLNIEISKSSHNYENQKNISDTLLQGSSLQKQLLDGKNIAQQLALCLQWNGEIKDQQLSYDLHATSIGEGYNNPGNLFLSSGRKELGGGFKKIFFKNQLQLSTKGNYRIYEYAGSNTTLRNYSFSFQAKWKLKKGQYIALRYQPWQSSRSGDDKKYSAGGSNGLSLDMNMRRRFVKINYQHTVTLSVMKNKYQFDSLPVNNNAILINSMQTFTINKQSYYLNAQYNKATAAVALTLFNTQFNCDAGIMYRLGKSIMSSSALTYNNTAGWYQQLGVKQSLSGQIGDRFMVSFYTNVLRNIKVYRPVNFDNVRLDWSLQYLIK